MTREAIRDAIVRANKLGARGVEVIDYIEPSSATDSDRIMLVIRWGQEYNAAELAWWDK